MDRRTPLKVKVLIARLRHASQSLSLRCMRLSSVIGCRGFTVNLKGLAVLIMVHFWMNHRGAIRQFSY